MTNTPDWVRGVVAKAQENPELLVSKIQDAASKFSWLLIPLSVPFLWLLFPFSRRYHLYDHTVFVTYSLSFMMMLVIARRAAGRGRLDGALPASCSSCRRSTCTGSSRGLRPRPLRRILPDDLARHLRLRRRGLFFVVVAAVGDSA